MSEDRIYIEKDALIRRVAEMTAAPGIATTDYNRGRQEERAAWMAALAAEGGCGGSGRVPVTSFQARIDAGETEPCPGCPACHPGDRADASAYAVGIAFAHSQPLQGEFSGHA